MRFALLLAATTGAGLMAGLFFVFSVAIMTALGRRPAAEGMAAMQAINVAIVNPLFLLVFLGTAVLSAVVLTLAATEWTGAGSALAAGGALAYLAGAVLVTIAINVPMNNALAGRTASDSAAEAEWRRYLRVWTAWNHVRTAASLAAMILSMLAAALQNA